MSSNIYYRYYYCYRSLLLNQYIYQKYENSIPSLIIAKHFSYFQVLNFYLQKIIEFWYSKPEVDPSWVDFALEDEALIPFCAFIINIEFTSLYFILNH